MGRSNMFANIENKFEFLEKSKITKIALGALGEFMEALEEKDNQVIFGIMILGAKLGVAGDGILNRQEKELIDAVFGRFWNGSMDEIYEMVNVEIEEKDYNMVEMLTQLGNSFSIPFLYYILSFAYIDGVIEDDVAERLDRLFGMTLLTDFIQSDEKEVTTTRKVQLTDLEAEIVHWFQEEDTGYPLKNIQAHFSDRSKKEVQKALDGLVDKGIIWGGDNIIENMYFLV